MGLMINVLSVQCCHESLKTMWNTIARMWPVSSSSNSAPCSMDLSNLVARHLYTTWDLSLLRVLSTNKTLM